MSVGEDTLRFPCPSCGHRVFRETPGSYEICPVCFWEDDESGLRCPDVAVGGPNHVSLVEAQRNYLMYGAIEARWVDHVRPPTEQEPREAAWRPADPQLDNFEPWEPSRNCPWPDDPTVLYYWRSTFWRRSARGAGA